MSNNNDNNNYSTIDNKEGIVGKPYMGPVKLAWVDGQQPPFCGYHGGLLKWSKLNRQKTYESRYKKKQKKDSNHSNNNSMMQRILSTRIDPLLVS